MNDIIRRKVAQTARAGGQTGTGGSPGADQGWRLAFARAARDTAGLMVEVVAMTQGRRSLAELLELPPDRALLVLLDGPNGGLGLLAMSAEVMTALIEMQTTGRVSVTAPMPRRATRTDAAMVAATIDRALEELDSLLADEADLVWAGGFRYASFLEDPRPLGLLLEDQVYRVLSADLTASDGARQGGLILALPAEGRGHRPAGQAAHTEPVTAAPPGFSAALGEAVLASDCVLLAVMGRLVLPLRQVMDLQVDQVLALPNAALDRISLESLDGRRLARTKLGQNKGMRALRMMPEAGVSAGVPTRPAGAAMGGPGPGLSTSAAGGFDPGAAMMPDPAFAEPEWPGEAAMAGAEAEDPLAGFGAPMEQGDGLLAAG